MKVSWDHPSILSRHMLALFVSQREGEKKKKKKIERKGIIIEMYRLSMFQGKTANLLRRYEGDIFIFRKKGEKKNSNGPFQAEDSFVAWNF